MAHQAERQLDQLESQPPSQADEQGAGLCSTRRSTAEPEEALPRWSNNIVAPVHDGPSQVKGESVDARGRFTKLWQKMKSK
jgi:hypothetical protein